MNEADLFGDLFTEGDLLTPSAVKVLEPLPDSRGEILAIVGPERQRIFATVRQLLDELEAAAPWSDLYYPPDDFGEFVALEERLLAVIESSPRRIRELLEELRAAVEDPMARQTIDDIEFYFSGIHEMASNDLAKLRSKLAPAVAGNVALTPAQRDSLCELTADLKGKYASAIMGATASILAEGHWTGLEIEPVMFPEKADEFDRNRELFLALQGVVQAVRDLPLELPFADIRKRWLLGQRIDQYALADLPTFRGRVGKLLKQRSRRALYSGDYRQIQRRERKLSARINELEEMHHLTWTSLGQSVEAVTQVFERLAQLLLEIAAIADVELLASLLGDKQVQRLRAIVVAEKEEDRRDRRDGDSTDARPPAHQQLERRRHPRREGLAEEHHALIPLLYEEDLRTFFDLLLGSVAKRASLALPSRTPRSAPQSAPASAPPPKPSGSRLESRPDPTATPRANQRLSGSFGSLFDAAGSEVATTQVSHSGSQVYSSQAFAARPAETTPAAPPQQRASAPPAGTTSQPRVLPATPPATATPGERLVAARLIRDEIARLRSPASSDWSSFRMIQRLVDKHAGVPPSMLQAAHPFLRNLQESLLPRLGSAISVGDLAPGIAQKLAQACERLLDPGLGPRQIRDETPEAIGRVMRILDGLEASAAALIAQLGDGTNR